MVKKRLADLISREVRWDAKGPVAAMLEEMLVNGEVPTHFSPKQVWEMKEEFMVFSLDKFRSGFNKIKNRLGFHVRDTHVSKFGVLLMYLLICTA